MLIGFISPVSLIESKIIELSCSKFPYLLLSPCSIVFYLLWHKPHIFFYLPLSPCSLKCIM